MEIWKPVPKWEGSYEASSLGNIRSCERTVEHGRHGIVSVKQKTLKPAIDKQGYLRVALCKDRSLTTYKVHRLVAITFHGFMEGLEVNHINGIKSDNRADNLEWCSRSRNVQHAFDTGLAIGLKGVKNPNAKLTKETAERIRAEYIPFEVGFKTLADRYGIAKKTAMQIIQKKIWV